MRALLVLVAACDFQPAPPARLEVKPPADAASVVEDASIARPDDASVIAVTDACLQTATHIADVLISSQADATLKASYETARERIVRATAEACTTQGWMPEAQRCYTQAKLEADLRACEKKFPTKAG